MNQCKAKTLKGKDCKNKSFKCDKDYCYIHSEKTTCAICLDKFNTVDSISIDPCGHGFHFECIIKITKHECPVCRGEIKNIPKKLMINIINETEEVDNIAEGVDIMTNLFYWNNIYTHRFKEISKAIEYLSEKSESLLLYLPNILLIDTDKLSQKNILLSNFIIAVVYKNYFDHINKLFYKNTWIETIIDSYEK